MAEFAYDIGGAERRRRPDRRTSALGSRPSAAATRTLGITEAVLAVYRAALSDPGTTLAELASRTGLSRREVVAACAWLERLGVLVRPAGATGQPVPVPLESAVEAMFMRAEEEIADDLHILHGIAMGLAQAQNAATTTAAVALAENVVGEGDQRSRFEQLQLAARREFLIFNVSPHTLEPSLADIEQRQLRNGVRYRIVYEASSLEAESLWSGLEARVRAGQEVRVARSLPMQLAIADASFALLPFQLSRSDHSHRSIWLNRSPLIHMARLTFDLIWSRAVRVEHGPRSGISAAEQALAESDGGGLSAVQRRILLMMATAADKDEVLARRLGIHRSTFRRHIAMILDELGAGTRFQAGVEAARRGLL